MLDTNDTLVEGQIKIETLQQESVFFGEKREYDELWSYKI